MVGARVSVEVRARVGVGVRVGVRAHPGLFWQRSSGRAGHHALFFESGLPHTAACAWLTVGARVRVGVGVGVRVRVRYGRMRLAGGAALGGVGQVEAWLTEAPHGRTLAW